MAADRETTRELLGAMDVADVCPTTVPQLIQMRTLLLITAVICGATAVVSAQPQTSAASCRRSLGMHSGAIPDETITASSSYDSVSVGPAFGRIRTERNGGAWCPKQQISRDVYEWLEIDLGQLKVVTQVETQGRFGNGQGQEFAESYMLEYRRVDTGPWIRFHDHNNNEVSSPP